MKKPSRAEQSFRAAFERLQQGRPEVLPAGSPLTQGNVAREAGRDPTAFKKKRYATLISEIQTAIELLHPDKARADVTSLVTDEVEPDTSLASRRRRNRSLREALSDARAQRDAIASILAEANQKILELTREIKVMRGGDTSGNVTSMVGRRKSRT